MGLIGLGIGGLSSIGHAEYGNPFKTRIPDIEFPELPLRDCTDSLVIHHIGSNDIDAPSEQINQWHLANGWQGLGYHYVIRKDGLIEYGRPLDCEGAHTYHENGHTVGILVDGSFTYSYPTVEQYESLIYVAASILYNYGLEATNGQTILGHCDFTNTNCPGDCLYSTIPDIAESAKEYLGYWRG